MSVCGEMEYKCSQPARCAVYGVVSAGGGRPVVIAEMLAIAPLAKAWPK
jgi:hypothetical protein